MNIKRALSLLGVSCLAIPLCWRVQAAELTPKKQSLAVPVTLPGNPPGSVECVVTRGPSVPVSAVAFSPDGKTLAAGGYQEVLIWDLEKATLSKRVGAGQIGGHVGALAFLHDGHLAVGEGTPYGSGAVRVFDVATGRQTHSFEEPAEVVYCLAVSPDGKLLAAGGADAVARVWSIEEKKLVATLEEHTDWILGVSFSPDGKLLATAGADRKVHIWDVTTWESTVKLRESDAVQGAAFGSDGRSLVLAVGGPSQQSLQIRRMDNLRWRRPISSGAGMPLDVIWTGKKNQIYVPCSDGVVRIYQAFGRLTASLTGHQDWVYCVALSPDQAKLASGSADGTVKLWNAGNGRLLATLVQLAPQEDDWLILTSAGHFAASSPNFLQWKTAGSETLPEELTNGLDKPVKVRKVLTKIAQPTARPRPKQRPKKQPKRRAPKKQKAND